VDRHRRDAGGAGRGLLHAGVEVGRAGADHARAAAHDDLAGRAVGRRAQEAAGRDDRVLADDLVAAGLVRADGEDADLVRLEVEVAHRGQPHRLGAAADGAGRRLLQAGAELRAALAHDLGAAGEHDLADRAVGGRADEAEGRDGDVLAHDLVAGRLVAASREEADLVRLRVVVAQGGQPQRLRAAADRAGSVLLERRLEVGRALADDLCATADGDLARGTDRRVAEELRGGVGRRRRRGRGGGRGEPDTDGQRPLGEADAAHGG
jgi:hypothetical protein